MTIARNSALSFAPQVVAIVAGLTSSVVTARLLGPEGRGTLSIVLMALAVMALVGDFGLGAAVTYFVSKRLLDGRSALGFCVAASFAGAAVVGLLVFALWPVLRTGVLRGVTPAMMALAFATLPATLFAALWVRLEMALGRFRTTMVYQSLGSVLLLVATIVVLVALKGSVFALVVATAVTTTLVSLFMIVDSARARGISISLSRDTISAMFLYGVRSYPGSLVHYSALRLDGFILNASAGNAAVGQYSMATTLAEKLWLVDNSIAQATMPEVVGRDADAARDLVAAATRTIVLLSLTFSGALYVVAPSVIGFLYGTAYLPAVLPLRILLPGVVFYASSRLLGQYYTGQLGRPEVGSVVSVVMAAIGIAAYLVLIPRYGAEGAALGSSITYGLTFVVNLVLFARITGLRMSEIVIPRREDVARLMRSAKRLFDR